MSPCHRPGAPPGVVPQTESKACGIAMRLRPPCTTCISMTKKKSSPGSLEESKKGALPPGFSTAKAQDVDDVTRSLAAIYGKQPGAAQEDLSHIEKAQKHAWMF